MKKRPLVSIVMSVYNGERFLEEALVSVERQTLADWEFVVVDDASTDATSNILKEHASKDVRYVLLRNETNLGLTKSLNKGITAARGEYIARMDADDISYPKRLERQVRFLQENSSVAVLGTWFEEVDEQGWVLRVERFPAEHEEIRKMMIRYEVLAHPTLMLPRQVFVDVGLYNEEWRYAQESELYFRLLLQGYRMANIPEVLFQWRRTKNSITSAKHRKATFFYMKAQLFALQKGLYGPLSWVFLLRSALVWLLPVGLKRTFKRVVMK